MSNTNNPSETDVIPEIEKMISSVLEGKIVKIDQNKWKEHEAFLRKCFGVEKDETGDDGNPSFQLKSVTDDAMEELLMYGVKIGSASVKDLAYNSFMEAAARGEISLDNDEEIWGKSKSESDSESESETELERD